MKYSRFFPILDLKRLAAWPPPRHPGQRQQVQSGPRPQGGLDCHPLAEAERLSWLPPHLPGQPRQQAQARPGPRGEGDPHSLGRSCCTATLAPSHPPGQPRQQAQARPGPRGEGDPHFLSSSRYRKDRCRVVISCVFRAGGIVGLVLAIIATIVAIGSTSGARTPPRTICFPGKGN